MNQSAVEIINSAIRKAANERRCPKDDTLLEIRAVRGALGYLCPKCKTRYAVSYWGNLYEVEGDNLGGFSPS